MTSVGVSRLIRQCGLKNDKLIQVLMDTIMYKQTIVMQLNNSKSVEYQMSEEDIKQISCDFLKYLEQKVTKDDIMKYIDTKVPKEYRNKLTDVYNTGGLNALKLVLKELCGTSSSAMVMM